MSEHLSDFLYLFLDHREVAQLGRVLGLGPRGRRFESCLPDVNSQNSQRPLKTEQYEPNVRVTEVTCQKR